MRIRQETKARITRAALQINATNGNREMSRLGSRTKRSTPISTSSACECGADVWLSPRVAGPRRQTPSQSLCRGAQTIFEHCERASQCSNCEKCTLKCGLGKTIFSDVGDG